MKRTTLFVTVFSLLVVLGGIYAVMTPEEKILRLATTTSTYDSGLLDYIIPVFEEKYNIEVQIISVGTGQAITNGERGDVDVIMVHSPEAELKFIDKRYGIDRYCVMYNDFVIVGPAEDPAGIKGMNIKDAMGVISDQEAIFVSRGDDSGTHKKELKLWKASGMMPAGSWYLESGDGMGMTLQLASEKGAYTLTDRATFTFRKKTLDLEILVDGDIGLLNPYGIIAVNPDMHPSVDYESATDFIDWFKEPLTQQLIAQYRVDGEQLFTPLNGECIGG
ncbi:MAG: substrate-binding domain-containing protein [Nanoarchaeota archaeon]|nr:substrate-binding domain-containing protein [Nanoarchaeota archaeon]